MERRIKTAITGLSLICACGTAAVGCGGGGGNGGGGAVNGITAGTWGSSSAELNIAASGNSLELNCSSNSLPPISPDSSGDFAFTAAYSSPPLNVSNARYQGHISGTTMLLTVTDPSNGNQDASYTLTEGTVMPPYTGSCPG